MGKISSLMHRRRLRNQWRSTHITTVPTSTFLPTCTNSIGSKGGVEILVARPMSECPVIWVLKLQTEIATSTLEAEYVALGHCCCALFPLLCTVKWIAEAVGIDSGEMAGMHIKLHEDNAGALTLAKCRWNTCTLAWCCILSVCEIPLVQNPDWA